MHENLTGLSIDVPAFRAGGMDLPNPLAGCRATGSPLRKIELSPIIGYQHGDLHGGNILVHAPRGGVDVDFFIIDFEHYKSDCPLLLDIAYFELSQLLIKREAASEARWTELIAVTAKLLPRLKAIEAATDPDNVGLLRFTGQVRDLVFSWQERQFVRRREDIERQYRLASVTAGLNYASKRQLDDDDAKSNKLKNFAYLYAAYHLKELYTFERIPIPDATPIRKPITSQSASTNAWRQIWSLADNFNVSRNTFVLIVGDSVRNLDLSGKEALSRLPWSSHYRL